MHPSGRPLVLGVAARILWPRDGRSRRTAVLRKGEPAPPTHAPPRRNRAFLLPRPRGAGTYQERSQARSTEAEAGRRIRGRRDSGGKCRSARVRPQHGITHGGHSRRREQRCAPKPPHQKTERTQSPDRDPSPDDGPNSPPPNPAVGKMASKYARPPLNHTAARPSDPPGWPATPENSSQPT